MLENYRHNMPEDEDINILFQHALHSQRMGYLTAEETSSLSTVLYFKSEHQFSHRWSLKEIGRRYGYNRLSEYIPLKDYLTLPASHIEQIIAGVNLGQMQRYKHEEEARKRREGTTEEADFDQAQKELVRKLKQLG